MVLANISTFGSIYIIIAGTAHEKKWNRSRDTHKATELHMCKSDSCRQVVYI